MARIVGDDPVREILDVGTGVGLLAVAMARRWPDANVVGVDIWDPALERARDHVAEAGLSDRIEIRNQDITTLDERDRYDCAFLPAPFLPTDVLAAAIPRVIEAVRPGGLVSIGTQRTPQDPLAEATQRLRNIRDTGAVHTVDSVLAMCHEAGLDASVLNPDSTSPSRLSADGCDELILNVRAIRVGMDCGDETSDKRQDARPSPSNIDPNRRTRDTAHIDEHIGAVLSACGIGGRAWF